jgi:hypothetical protein
MPADTQKKRQDVDKLRRILDNPNDPTLTTNDPSLDNVRRRLNRTKTTPTTTRTRTPSSMQPHVTIRQPPTTTDLPRWTTTEPTQPTPTTPTTDLPLWTPTDTPTTPQNTDNLPLWTPLDSDTPPSTKNPLLLQRLDFSDQDLFEVELLQPGTASFELIQDTSPQPTTQTHDLPDWQPVTPQTPTQEPLTIPLQEFTEITPEQPTTPPLPPSEPRQSWRQRRATRKTARIQAREAKRREKLTRTTTPTPPPEQPTYTEPPTEPLPTFEPTPTPSTKTTHAFQTIPSIDATTADLLIRHGITTPAQLKHTPIDTLVKIKGIKRKHARQIKKDADKAYLTRKELPAPPQETPKQRSKRKPKKTEKTEETETEWESYETAGELHIPPVYTYEGYTLYQRETKIGRKTSTLHFFSKNSPKDGIPASLPNGYTIDVNRRTGIPYLKKKK